MKYDDYFKTSVWRENKIKAYLERYPEDTKLEDFEDWLDYKREQGSD